MEQQTKYLFKILEYLKDKKGVIKIETKHIEPIKEIIRKELDKNNGFQISFNSDFTKIKIIR